MRKETDTKHFHCDSSIDGLPTFEVFSNELSVADFGEDSDLRAYQTELAYTVCNTTNLIINEIILLCSPQPNLPIPSSYSLSLQSLDGLGDMDYVETTAMMEPQRLTLNVVSGLSFRRLWNCTIFAYGCEENSILSGAQLSELNSTYNTSSNIQ